VPTHENAEGELVSGHWVYVRFTDFRWFTDAPAGPLGLGGRPAPIPDDVPPPPWPPASGIPTPVVPWSEAVPPAANGTPGPPSGPAPAPPHVTPAR
jgi:hypothetical protein